MKRKNKDLLHGNLVIADPKIIEFVENLCEKERWSLRTLMLAAFENYIRLRGYK